MKILNKFLIILFTLNVVDVITTILGLRVGLVEMGLQAVLYPKLGIYITQIFKLFMIIGFCCCVVTIQEVFRKKTTHILNDGIILCVSTLNIIYFMVIMMNIYLLLKVVTK
jgi:hypothetical protein